MAPLYAADRRCIGTVADGVSATASDAAPIARLTESDFGAVARKRAAWCNAYPASGSPTYASASAADTAGTNVSLGNLFRPEQAVTRTVWSREQIVESRKLVIEWECYRLYGTYGCVDGKYDLAATADGMFDAWTSSYANTTTPSGGFFDLEELTAPVLKKDNRWWMWMNRYSPETFTSGTLAGCWGDPLSLDTTEGASRVDDLEGVDTTGGDCLTDPTNPLSAVANRGQMEGPADLMGDFHGFVADCSVCTDGVDNNCNGVMDGDDPGCAQCSLGQGYACGCSAGAGSSRLAPTTLGLTLLSLLLASYRRREHP